MLRVIIKVYVLYLVEVSGADSLCETVQHLFLNMHNDDTFASFAAVLEKIQMCQILGVLHFPKCFITRKYA